LLQEAGNEAEILVGGIALCVEFTQNSHAEEFAAAS
jgi:hypothetical protein